MKKTFEEIAINVRRMEAQNILTASVIGVSDQPVSGENEGNPIVAGAQGRTPVPTNHPLNH